MKLEQAKRFLLQELADGPTEGRVVTCRAEEAGISTRTLRRAREALGLTYVRPGVCEPVLWALPEDTPVASLASLDDPGGVEVLPSQGYARPSGVSDRETIRREIGRVYSDPQRLWEALERNRGLLGPTAAELNVSSSREALEFLKDSDPNVEELVRRAVERALDRTIGRLWEVADQGHVPALGRLLQATAAHRGFGASSGGRRSADDMVDVTITLSPPWGGVYPDAGEPFTWEVPRFVAEELPDEILIQHPIRERGARLYGEEMAKPVPEGGPDDGPDGIRDRGPDVPRDHS